MFRCSACGGNIKIITITDYVYDTSLGDIPIQGKVKLEECGKCHDRFVSGKDMESWNRQIIKQMASKKRLLKPKELGFIFSVLPYNQAELAEALGRDSSTLTKYKKGENPFDKVIDHALKKIMQDFAKGRDDTFRELTESYSSDANEVTGTFRVAAKGR